MLDITLYGMNYIHDITYIACTAVHSCVPSHYMAVLTFMYCLTLHEWDYIHHLVPTLGVL